MRAVLLVLVLLLAACDSYGVDAPRPTPTPVAGIDTLGAVRLDPRAAYLRVADDPDATAAVPLLLSRFGVAPGDSITFFVSGYASLDPTDPTARSRDVIGVFAASDALEQPDVRQRVRNALDAGTDVTTDSTAIGRLPTDIAGDFFATRATVSVPPGATHLFLSLHDGHYSDNLNVGDGVLVTVLRRR